MATPGGPRARVRPGNLLALLAIAAVLSFGLALSSRSFLLGAHHVEDVEASAGLKHELEEWKQQAAQLQRAVAEAAKEAAAAASAASAAAAAATATAAEQRDRQPPVEKPAASSGSSGDSSGGSSSGGGAAITPGPAHQPSPVELAAAAGFNRSAVQLGPAAAKWAPLVVSACTEHMPRHWAPCLVGSANNPTVAYGEEVIYPAFSIPQPGFLTPEHAEWWRSVVPPYEPHRFWLREGRGLYPAQHGQNLLLRNVRFVNSPVTDAWVGGACMAGDTSHRGLPALDAGTSPDTKQRAVLANTPDSAYFQHFLDRVTKVMVQTEGWRQDGTQILTGGQPFQQYVTELWRIMLEKPGKQEVRHGVTEASLAEMVFPCRCPLTHPFFNERLREYVGMPQATPLEERKVVLYLSRNTGGSNGSRQVTNEEAVLAAIREVLQQRGRGEELVVYNQNDFPSVGSLVQYMHRNVSALVGPHGGAFYNVWWAARDTLLLEFMPKTRLAVMIWEEGSFVGARYFVLPCDTTGNHDMEVPPELVKQALREQLGQRSNPPEPQLHSEWMMSQMLKRR